MTREEAIALAQTGWWKGRDLLEVFWFQINEPKLCMDFPAFHEAAEKALGRPVWTHEFAHVDALRAEFLKERKAPSIAEILDLIPTNKRVAVFVPDEAPHA